MSLSALADSAVAQSVRRPRRRPQPETVPRARGGADAEHRAFVMPDVVEPSQAGGKTSAGGGSQSSSSSTTSPLEIAGAANLALLVRQLTALLPSEVLAVYIVAASLIPTTGWVSGSSCSRAWPSAAAPDTWLWTITIVCTVLCPFMVLALTYDRTRRKALRSRFPWWPMMVSLIGFMAWSIYIPNSIIAHCFNMPTYATIVTVLVASIVIYSANVGLRAIGGPSIDIPDVGAVVLPQQQPQQQSAIVTGRAPGGAGPAADLVLYGSLAVVARSNIFCYFIGSYWKGAGAAERTACIDFLDMFLRSSLYGELSNYGVGHGSVKGAFDSPTEFTGTIADDADVQPELRACIAREKVVLDQNSVHVVFTPKDVLVDASMANNNGLTGVGHCSYHYVLDSTPYAVIPYPQATPCLEGKSTMNALATEICHELAEVLTNPNITSGGWTTNESKGREIADLCQGEIAHVGPYSVQPLWVNGHGCVGDPVRMA